MAWVKDVNLGSASQNNTNTTIAFTSSAAVAAGAWIFVAVNYKNGSGIIASAADNSGSPLTWSVLRDSDANGTSRIGWVAAYAASGLASGTIITVTFSGAPTASGNICGVSFTGGPVGGTVLDTGAGNTWTSPQWTASITTGATADNSLILAAMTIVSTTSISSATGIGYGTEDVDFYGGANARWFGVSHGGGTYPGGTFVTLRGTITTPTGPVEPLTSVLSLKSPVASTSSGPNSPSSAVDNADQGNAWTNVNNVFASDNTYATCTAGVDALTNTLRVAGFGFSIPAGAVVTGVTIQIEWLNAAGGMVGSSYQLHKNNVALGTAKDTEENRLTESYESVGGTADSWGATLTDTDVNDTTFGVLLQWHNSDVGATRTVSVDHVRMTVTYQQVQRVRPDGDVTTTGWSTAPLFSKVNESVADGTVITATAV